LKIAPFTPPPSKCSICILGLGSGFSLKASGPGSIAAPHGTILIKGKTKLSGKAKLAGADIGIFPKASHSFRFSPQPVLLGTQPTDPFASLKPPPFKRHRCRHVPAGQETVTLSPGTYCGLSLSGRRHLKLRPGAYVFTGGVHLTGHSLLTGRHATLYLA